jgi:hypothetical protein
MPKPIHPREEPRVGHGVGGAGEEVGEPDGLAQVARQDGERQVEAAADVAEEAPE